MSTMGSIDYMNCSVPAADTAINAGLAATDPQAAEGDFEQAGDLLVRSNCWDLIANVEDTIVARQRASPESPTRSRPIPPSSSPP